LPSHAGVPAPIKPSLEASALPVWLALDDKRQKPPIRLPHDVAGNRLAGRPRVPSCIHRADTGQPQFALAPVGSRGEPKAVPVVLEAKPGETIVRLEPGEPWFLRYFYALLQEGPERQIKAPVGHGADWALSAPVLGVIGPDLGQALALRRKTDGLAGEPKALIRSSSAALYTGHSAAYGTPTARVPAPPLDRAFP